MSDPGKCCEVDSRPHPSVSEARAIAKRGSGSLDACGLMSRSSKGPLFSSPLAAPSVRRDIPIDVHAFGLAVSGRDFG